MCQDSPSGESVEQDDFKVACRIHFTRVIIKEYRPVVKLEQEKIGDDKEVSAARFPVFLVYYKAILRHVRHFRLRIFEGYDIVSLGQKEAGWS